MAKSSKEVRSKEECPSFLCQLIVALNNIKAFETTGRPLLLFTSFELLAFYLNTCKRDPYHEEGKNFPFFIIKEPQNETIILP